MKLYKISEPGWTKTFETKCEVQQELLKYMCQQCQWEENITEISDIDAMLATACGCEFWVDLK